MAELASRIGRTGEAGMLLRRAIETDPGFTPAQFNLAFVLNRSGRHGEALEVIKRLLARPPVELGHLNLKASILRLLGRFEKAIATCRQVLRQALAQPKLHLGIGTMLKTIRRVDEAIAAYRADSRFSRASARVPVRLVDVIEQLTADLAKLVQCPACRYGPPCTLHAPR